MDNLIKSVYKYDLSGVDVEYLTRGKSKVILYDNLKPSDDIVDLIGSTNQVLLLFPTQEGSPDGHWLSITYNELTKTIRHWDSYGLSPAAEIQYSNNKLVKSNILGRLYAKAQLQGYKFEYNTHRLQKMNQGDNQCGRWSSLRNRFAYLSTDQFAKLFLNQKESPDYLCTILTFLSLAGDQRNESAILEQLS